MEPATAGNQVTLLILQKLFMWEKKTKCPLSFLIQIKTNSNPYMAVSRDQVAG